MKSIFLFFLGWLFCSGVFAQEELFRTFHVYRQSDTVHLNLNRRGPILRDFFSGVFFNRVNESVLRIPTTSYKDRFLKCENCEIVNYSVKQQQFNGGRVGLEGLDLWAEPTEEKVYLTTITPKGDTLSRLEVFLSPKVTFYLKINDEMVKIDDTSSMPPFRLEDELSFVVIAENGKRMKVKKHLVYTLSIMTEWRQFPDSEVMPDFEKVWILSTQPRKYLLDITFSDEKGNSWQSMFTPFFK